MKKLAFLFFAATLMSAMLSEAQTRCSVKDFEEYYGEALDEEYKIDREALAIADGLFSGPLMKQGRAADVEAFRGRFVTNRDMEIEELQEMVRNHLYGKSREFRDLVTNLADDNTIGPHTKGIDH